MDRLEKLQQVFRNVFEDERLVITTTTSARHIKMWDSLTHIELIAAVEQEFNIQFSFAEVMQFDTVDDMMNAINEKI